MGTNAGATSVAELIREHRYADAKEATLLKLAEAFDATTSARDLKAISIALLPEIEVRIQYGEGERTALDDILEEARRMGEE